MTSNNERQAYTPEGAIPVENPNGTAPAFVVEDPRGVIFVLPGVPFELKWLFEHETEPYLRKKFRLAEIITYRVLKVAGLGESSVDDRIGHLIEKLSNPTVGVLAHPGQVDVRIAAKAANRVEAMKLIAPVEAEVRELLGRHIFATDNETIEDVVGGLLRERNKTVAVFEDLTSGLLAERLQQASSEHFVEGFISKNSTSISRLLAFSDRPQDLEQLAQDPVALTGKLALAVRAQSGTDFGLALHGVADPEDRTVNLARGQTFIAVTDGKRSKNHTYHMAGKSQQDRARMSLNAIELLRMALLEGMG